MVCAAAWSHATHTARALPSRVATTCSCRPEVAPEKGTGTLYAVVCFDVVRLTRLLQVKLGALAGIKKKTSQTGKNRDRYVHVLRVARVRIGHSEFADATRSVRLSVLWNVALSRA